VGLLVSVDSWLEGGPCEKGTMRLNALALPVFGRSSNVGLSRITINGSKRRGIVPSVEELWRVLTVS
jgi:hypothetical protein